MSFSRPAREVVMTALFNTLKAALEVEFTADTSVGSAVLLSPSSAAGLFVGLPVFGAGIPRLSVITALSPLTLSQPATANATAVALITGFLTFSRRFQFATGASEQPALFLRDGDERVEYPNTLMQKVFKKAEIYIYSKAGADPEAAPAQALNYLVDAVQAALAPDEPGGLRFTLGGLVPWCRIVGDVELFPGDLDGQAAAIIDVEIQLI